MIIRTLMKITTNLSKMKLKIYIFIKEILKLKNLKKRMITMMECRKILMRTMKK